MRDEFRSVLSSLKNQSPTSPSTEALRAETDGKKQDEFWTEAAARLRRYGVALVSQTIDAARSRGWTALQVIALIDECERRSVGDIRAWPAGLVATHLRTADPGTSIKSPVSAEYKHSAAYRGVAGRVDSADTRIGKLTAGERRKLGERAFANDPRALDDFRAYPSDPRHDDALCRQLEVESGQEASQ
jgi:hypothetical protein